MANEEGDYQELLWRVQNDKPSQDQFEHIRQPTGYVCECVCDPGHLAAPIPAEWRRPPMPEKRAKHPMYMCDACHKLLPLTQ